MKRVRYLPQYLTACRCSQCLVQDKSVCAKEEIKEIREKIDPFEEMPLPIKTPLIYCSRGQANCLDLNFNQKCACPTCPVWVENGLGARYYCHNGNADLIG